MTKSAWKQSRSDKRLALRIRMKFGRFMSIKQAIEVLR